MSADSMRRDHVRRADLPWRSATRTECGKALVDVASYISRADLVARVSRDGIQRAAYSTCMVCLETAKRWPDWAADPIAAVQREFYGGRPDPRLLDELRALAALVEAHRDEFDEYLTGLAETISLADRRRARGRAS